MARIQLITNVSDFGFFLGVAKSRARLVAATLTMLAITGGTGVWMANYILETSQSVGLNLVIITLTMILVLITSYFMAMLVGDLFFPGPWREQVLLGQTPADDSMVSIDDHNLEFVIVLAISVVLNAFALNYITDGFMDRYQAEGFFAVQLRSDDVEDRIDALSTIAEPMNFELWKRPGLKEIVTDAFDDPDERVRMRAYWTAGLFKDINAQPALIKVLEGGASAGEKKEAAVALGKINDPEISRAALEALAAENAAPEATVGALRGLGLLAKEESLQVAMDLSASSDESVMMHAFWLIRQIGSDKARTLVKEGIAQEPTGNRRCALYDTLKMVATPDDVLWAKREFQTTDPALPESTECEFVVWTDHDESKHILIYGDSYREKLMKIVANADAFAEKDWFQLQVNDPELPFRLRQVGTAVLRQIEEAKYR
ncbi:HEAT repeat domain-containing protein [Bradymonas sediminis]|uniref:Uncharacterized protein n=1 Tax=Bradymonas sediminis TaxID=1548548 RepID=A0A2Z4FM82_9DELT|nr:HEAT repeat domain-containing protein [Bradymonas sediminis]AWV90042.1 hypothetical protein DN745_12105 [Bradymonas sediminis]TDP75999.1 hypothetical protein DFR33_103349 [Bradymonas sediminis]